MTSAAASAMDTIFTAPPRGFSSTSPLASDFSPRLIRSGNPTSSLSLNFTPGRSSRSSRITSSPAAVSSARSCFPSVIGCPSGTMLSGVMQTWYGATLTGQRMPSLSLHCSMTAWSVRVTPMP